MRRFDELFEEYQKQVVMEADASPTLTGYASNIKNAIPFVSGKPFITPKYNPSNVYYLIKGFKNIPELRQRLGTLLTQQRTQQTTNEATVVPNPMPSAPESAPSPASPTPQIQQNTPTKTSTATKSSEKRKPTFTLDGKIANDADFATILLNAFDEASEINRNYVTLNDLIRGYIKPTTAAGTMGTERQTIGEIQNIPKDKAHQSIIDFINRNKLSDLIKYVTPEQAAEMDKGGVLKRAGTAFNKFAGQAIQDLGKLQGKTLYQ
jgi:hypothetical protein